MGACYLLIFLAVGVPILLVTWFVKSLFFSGSKEQGESAARRMDWADTALLYAQPSLKRQWRVERLAMLDYIENALRSGKGRTVIAADLEAKGWSGAEIAEAFGILQPVALGEAPREGGA